MIIAMESTHWSIGYDAIKEQLLFLLQHMCNSSTNTLPCLGKFTDPIYLLCLSTSDLSSHPEVSSDSRVVKCSSAGDIYRI